MKMKIFVCLFILAKHRDRSISVYSSSIYKDQFQSTGAQYIKIIILEMSDYDSQDQRWISENAFLCRIFLKMIGKYTI